jgi:Icc-related predicted phosphoesterase
VKILYGTDLHGRIAAYEKTFERALDADVRAIVNGGDLYPLGSDLFEVQEQFISGYLSKYIERCAQAGLDFLCTLGNMDLRGLDSEFIRVMDSVPSAHCLLDEMLEFEGYSFIGSPMTVDGPFALKDRCLRDTEHSADPPVGGRALVSDSNGLHQVDDWGKTRAELPSLSQHLACLPRPPDPHRAVYVLHQPPFGAGLGMISKTVDVGSQAVAEFLAERKGLLSLHGHIHESPFVGGRWRVKRGETTCVQPGQLMGKDCVSVVIDLENLEMDRSC